MPPDPLAGLKKFSGRFVAIKIFRVTIRTSQILGWIRPWSSSTHFGEKATVRTKFDFKLINAIEVYNKLKTLDKNKAAGIHNIPNKMLLLCADIVAPHLADIFDYSLVSKNFLDDFKIGKVSSLFKNGERERILITIDPFQSCHQ